MYINILKYGIVSLLSFFLAKNKYDFVSEFMNKSNQISNKR